MNCNSSQSYRLNPDCVTQQTLIPRGCSLKKFRKIRKIEKFEKSEKLENSKNPKNWKTRKNKKKIQGFFGEFKIRIPYLNPFLFIKSSYKKTRKKIRKIRKIGKSEKI